MGLSVSVRAHARPRGGVRRLFGRIASGAPVRVFTITGTHPPGDPEDLRLDFRIELLDSPRSATVLLVTGVLPLPLYEPAKRVHDAMASPRHVVLWQDGIRVGASNAELFPNARIVHQHDDVVATLVGVQRELLGDDLFSSPPLLPDVEPAPWRGIGPYGQGGSGMTGGVPYGRPMTERAPDRDGLELDHLPLRVGPFYPAFPGGLVLDIKLQGDVVQDIAVVANPFDSAATSAKAPDLFHLALTQTVPVADLERARACHHLRWLAQALRIAGLSALGLRARAIAQEMSHRSVHETLAAARRLRRLVERSGIFVGTTKGIGRLDGTLVSGRGLGPVARASGVAEDARIEDPAYQALAFTPVVQRGALNGDTSARWRQRLDEIAQSLTIADVAGESLSGAKGIVEAPRGLLRANAPARDAALELVPQLLRGMEWGDAVTAIVSLDLVLSGAQSIDSGSPPSAARSVQPARDIGNAG